MNLTKRLIYLAAVADTTPETFNARLRAIASRVLNDKGEPADYRSILASVSGSGCACPVRPCGIPAHTPHGRAMARYDAMDESTATLAHEAAHNLMAGSTVAPAPIPTNGMIGVTTMARPRSTPVVDPIAGIASILAPLDTMRSTLIAAYGAATGETGADSDAIARRNAYLSSPTGKAVEEAYGIMRDALDAARADLDSIKARKAFAAEAKATREFMEARKLPEALILSTIASLPGAPVARNPLAVAAERDGVSPAFTVPGCEGMSFVVKRAGSEFIVETIIDGKIDDTMGAGEGWDADEAVSVPFNANDPVPTVAKGGAPLATK